MTIWVIFGISRHFPTGNSCPAQRILLQINLTSIDSTSIIRFLTELHFSSSCQANDARCGGNNSLGLYIPRAPPRTLLASSSVECRSSRDVMKLLALWAVASLATQAVGAAIKHKLNGFTITEHPDPVKRDLLQKYACVFLFYYQQVCANGYGR